MIKIFAALSISITVWSTIAVAQSRDATDQSAIRQSAIFLEQVVGPWALILPKWNVDPTSDDWKTARQSCLAPLAAQNPEVVKDADPKIPPKDMLFGSLVYYRGADGLQQYSAADNQIRSYPNLRVGRSNSGAPVYEISGSGGKVIINIGKINSDSGSAIVMVRENALLLRCKQT